MNNLQICTKTTSSLAQFLILLQLFVGVYSIIQKSESNNQIYYFTQFRYEWRSYFAFKLKFLLQFECSFIIS